MSRCGPSCAGFSRRVRLNYIEETTLPRLLNAVKAIPPGSVLLYIWQTVSSPATWPIGRDPRLVAEAAPVPCTARAISTWGLALSAASYAGRAPREFAPQKWLSGSSTVLQRKTCRLERPGWCPASTGASWGGGVSTRPDSTGSDIRFRTPTVWELYRGYIIAIAVALAAQLLLIAGLLVQRHHRQRAEETITQREATLRTSYERIRQLAGRLINAQEAARAGLARDLHDDVCQQLVFVSLAVSSLKSSSGEIQGRETQEAFSDLEQKTEGMFNGLRRLSHDLHPASLRLLGLGPALKTHCAEVAKGYDVEVDFRTDGEVEQLHQDVAVCLFRIAQESLRNGVVHGGARRFRVLLARSNGHVELTVSDEGRGFDLEVVRRDGGGLGLVSMEERARVVGGDVGITTGFEKGTTVRVRCPAGLRQSGQPASVSRSDSPEVVGHF